MTAQQERKQIIRQFMREHYTDERLAQLLAHAQSGRLRYMSCCCFIGIPSAPHPLQKGIAKDAQHYLDAARLDGYVEAEQAFCRLSLMINEDEADEIRRRILIPMIRAEMRRRDRLHQHECNESAPAFVHVAQ